MSTKYQTRQSNNYNCFQQCCVQSVPFLSLCVCMCLIVSALKNTLNIHQPELNLMNEMGTKCFDILSMFHGWLLRVLLQYSSPLLILISHYGIDCLCLQSDSCQCVSVLYKHTHTHIFYAQTCQSIVHFVIKLVRESELFAGHYVCVCECEMCDVFINVYPPPQGAFEVPHFFFGFWLFFSLEEKLYQRIFLKYE